MMLLLLLLLMMMMQMMTTSYVIFVVTVYNVMLLRPVSQHTKCVYRAPYVGSSINDVACRDGKGFTVL